MKRIIISCIALFAFVSMGFAQNTFNKGDKVLSFGLGFGNTLTTFTGAKTKILPVSVSYEQGIIDGLLKGKASIGAGGLIGYSKSKWDVWGYGDYELSHVVIGGRGAFHYQLVDKLDTYAGLVIGYDIVSDNASNGAYVDESSSLLTSEFVGARYYFNDNFSAFGELGYGIAYMTLGVSFKF
jgi:hypothetical protein